MASAVQYQLLKMLAFLFFVQLPYLVGQYPSQKSLRMLQLRLFSVDIRNFFTDKLNNILQNKLILRIRNCVFSELR